jgi:hypothetical protein
MTVKIGQTIFSPWLTPVRVMSDANISGTYYNGIQNDGVGATLTVAASSLTVDDVVMVASDRVLLTAQTSANENGIYIVKSIDSQVVLQRASDQQSLDQYKSGQYVSIAAGTDNAGSFYTLVEPLPAVLGVDDLTWSPVASGGGGGLVTYGGFSELYLGGSDQHIFTIPAVPGLLASAQNIFTLNNVPILSAINQYPLNPENLLVIWSADPGVAQVFWIGVVVE